MPGSSPGTCSVDISMLGPCNCVHGGAALPQESRQQDSEDEQGKAQFIVDGPRRLLAVGEDEAVKEVLHLHLIANSAARPALRSHHRAGRLRSRQIVMQDPSG